MCFKHINQLRTKSMDGPSDNDCQFYADEVDGNADHNLKSPEIFSSDDSTRVQTCPFDVCGNYSCECEICTAEAERAVVNDQNSRNYRLQRLKTENEKFKSSVICRNCNLNNVQILTLPCSHIVCCEKCADRLDNCPLCDDRILGTVRIYMA